VLTSQGSSAKPIWAASTSQWTTLSGNIYFNTGNVGIGTTTPSQKIHVVGNGLFDNDENNTNYANVSIFKSKLGSYNMGAGQIIGEYRFQNGVASMLGVTTATTNGGYSNAEIAFYTTNQAGSRAERFRITEQGLLNYASDMSASYTSRSVVDKAYVDGAGFNIQQTLVKGDTTNRVYIYKHRPHLLVDVIQRLDPNNKDSVYTFSAAPYTAQSFYQTVARFDGVNSSGRPNYVWMQGYNNNAGGGRVASTDASFHHALESHYETGGAQVFEWHKQMTTTTGNLVRLESWLINKQTAENSVYYSTDAWDLRRSATNEPYFAASRSGIDLNNSAVLGTSRILMYAGPSADNFSILHGNGTTTMGPTTASYDFRLTTPRNLQFSNNILFTSTYAPNGGDVTFDLPSVNSGKSFHFRDLGQTNILSITDSAAGNKITVNGGAKITGLAGAGNRPVLAEPDGKLSTVSFSGSPFIDFFDYVQKDSIMTVDGTSTAISQITIPDNTTGTLTYEVTAFTLAGDVAHYSRKVRYKKLSGTLTLKTDLTAVADEEDAAMATCVADASIASNNIIVTGGGLAATNVYWKANCGLTYRTIIAP
jgi:hypothetical protein